MMIDLTIAALAVLLLASAPLLARTLDSICLAGARATTGESLTLAPSWRAWLGCGTTALMLPLTPDLLLRAYASGVFPMAERRHASDVFWVEPKARGVMPIAGFHVPRSLAKVIKREPFQVRVDTAFRRVMEACAESRDGREETWINDQILDGYTALHRAGFAHSVECWQGEQLVGGLYGVSLRGAFFGESMFSRMTDASKVALVYLVARLKAGGYRLLDTQFLTDHLARFGTQEVSRRDYKRLLDAALDVEGQFAALDAPQPGGASAGASAAGAGSGAGVVAGADARRGRARASASSSAEPLPRLSSADCASTSTVSGPLSGKLILQLITQTS
jgi:leucyl/phenylalanyl-tRNA---protein transferase